MQSSLATVVSLASGFSPRPRVSVLGTGRPRSDASRFSWRVYPAPSYSRSPAFLPSGPGACGEELWLPRPCAPAAGLFQSPGLPCHPRHGHRHADGLRNLRRIPIDCASRPRLRPRLTPGGRTSPGRPRPSGWGDSHPPSLLTPAFSLACAPRALAVPLRRTGDAPLPILRIPRFRRRALAPVNCRRGAA